jgi:two-component system copper resistance phosphate regulon response regulator CusR
MENLQILIVEDEKKIADTIQKGLAENGYSAVVSYDGLEAQKAFVDGKYAIVILDINLPGMNGYELCKWIRTQDETVFVIMLTALNSLENKIEGYDAGADDYIIKPFEFSELLLKVRVLLKRSQQHPDVQPIVYHAADLELDLAAHTVKREGRIINLTSKEFQLLGFLLRNKNRVVSRADIAVNVWDIDFDTNTNIIDVYINYLRNKIDKPFKRKLIHTQVGMGYILKDI